MGTIDSLVHSTMDCAAVHTTAQHSSSFGCMQIAVYQKCVVDGKSFGHFGGKSLCTSTRAALTPRRVHRDATGLPQSRESPQAQEEPLWPQASTKNLVQSSQEQA